MTRFRALLIAAALVPLAVACNTEPPVADGRASDESPDQRATRLAREMILIDTHVDVPYRLREKMADISARTADGHFDWPRAREGGLDVAFMSIYVPASYQGTGGARAVADELIDLVEGFERDHPDKFAIARSTADVRRLFVRGGLVALPMGMENGAPVETLDDLAYFHGRGIRYITLTHSEDNQICDSSYSEERRWSGLSEFGREVVSEMNRLGIMIDVSHVSDETFDQVLAITEAPVIASHSSCRAFTPGWQRNMDDRMIRNLADNGGVIQINFGSAFLTEAAQEQSTDFWSRARAFADEHGYGPNDPGAREFTQAYWRENKRIYADIQDVVAHIRHVIDLVGVDHVGFGSDFDGVGDSLPVGLKDVSDYPNLVRALLDAGLTEAEVEKICGGNLMRVWGEVEAVARRLQSGA